MKAYQTETAPYSDSTIQGEWFALHVRSRHEKLVSRQLDERGITNWLPLLETRRRWSDRYKIINEPLFPGYLFVSIASEDRFDALYARGTVGFVSFNGCPCPVPAEQLEQVRRALASKLKCNPYPYLHKGRPAEILRGPLKGLSGTLIQKNRKHRFVLSVPLIGRSVAVELDAVDIRPL